MQLHTILRAAVFACLFVFCNQAAEAGQPEQGITLSVTRERLEKVFKEIEGQTNVSFIYSRETLSRSKPVTINVKNEQLERLLKTLFNSQPMTYAVDGAFVIVRSVAEKTDTLPSLASFRAKLVNEAGAVIPGATINIKGTANSITSDNNGEFILRNLTPGTILLITGAELETTELRIGNETSMTVTLKPKMNELDQVLVMAYGETTRRLNTGSIGKVSAAEIQRQPVSNPLAALHGRVPGVVVTQSSGMPGASVKIQIRGQNSITQGSDPLFVIDGIPFGPNNNIVNQIRSAAGANNSGSPGGLSPFNSINPGDIESIEVLKDADATAIYGSRGANGVVLITTKQGKAGKTQVSINAYSGFSKLTRVIPMLTTQQYVMMRREAFANDGLIPDAATAPEITVWDTTRYTNLTDALAGHTPSINDVQLTVSGGNALNQFSVRAAYHKETTAFPGNMYEQRSSAHFNFNHISADRRFKLQLSTGYSSDENNLNTVSLLGSTLLPPNLPPLRDSLGELAWEDKGVAFDNPLAYLLREYRSVTSTFLSNATLSYRIIGDLNVKALLGYNVVDIDEQDIFPLRAYPPGSSVSASTQISSQKIASWSVEPQIEWSKKVRNWKVSALVGASIQKTQNKAIYVLGSGFASDALVKDIQSAATVTGSNSQAEYRYQAAFARINLNFLDKYILNFSGRRDGSTRFGPDSRYANFGAVGMGWIFSSERFAMQIPGLSFGKLRMSYGTTGNDQIGNYQYLDTWSPSFQSYQGNNGLRPTRLFNPHYSWEVNKKAELALELGFLHDKLLITGAYFRNRSSNQLVNYNIPAQTGFTSVLRNFPAVVQNSGIELSTTANIINTGSIKWSLSANISFPENKLISFPGIEMTAYASQLEIGRSLQLIRAFEYLGVDPQTGFYTFNDVNRDGILNSSDRMYLGDLVPDYTGGISQQLSYKGLQLDIFFMFVKQLGRNFLSGAVSPAGDVLNQPAYILDRWQKPGDIATVQKFTTDPNFDIYKVIANLNLSNGIYSDASFWRLKNLSLSYGLPAGWLNNIKASQCRIFIQAQNVLTFTSYKGSDPENQALYGTLPLMRTFTGGIQLTF
ncbi:MAG: SusC/RagA family TonB-linked outer membrane protein [Citrobacter freundii]|nr:MAG: SusC/RagA family TonB-linked outer membrane protein [Citrobacter freundii]